MGIEIFGSSTNDELQEVRKVVTSEEAAKKGYLSPKGMFALLGDLDFYLLIEKLVKFPVPEDQLTTPVRWWMLLKGFALAALISFLLTCVRIALLAPGETVPFVLKFYVYLFFYWMTIVGFMASFLKYIYFPRGITVKAVNLVMSGFTWGLMVDEAMKTLVILISIHYRDFFLEKLGDISVISLILDVYYSVFASNLSYEFFNYVVCATALLLGRVILDSKVRERAKILAEGKPYNLESDVIV